MIASAILSVFFFALFRMYRGVTDSFRRANWSLGAQTSLRNSLTLIREEMQRASYRSAVTINSLDVRREDEFHNYRFAYRNDPASGNDDVDLARWYICIPLATVGGVTEGAVIQCLLRFQAGNVTLSRRLIEGAAPEEAFYENRTIISGIGTFTFSLGAPGENQVVMRMQMLHPDQVSFPNVSAESETGAKFEVEIIPL